MRKYTITKRISLLFQMDLHIPSLPGGEKKHTHTRILKQGLNGWMDFIRVWYLMVYIIGQCPVDMNITASKI
jgi:hypothetical protein